MTNLAELISTRKLKGPETTPFQLKRRRIYILPTRHGYLFSVVLFSMLIGSLNYNNSLAFALTFLLASIAVVSMIHSHRNLADLVIDSAQSSPVFADDPAHFHLLLKNEQNKDRLAITIGVKGLPSQTIDIPAAGKVHHEILFPSSQRGWLRSGRIKIFTEYPLGLLHTWTWINPDLCCLVYPRPEQNAPAPFFQGESEGEFNQNTSGDDDFTGLREYRKGDSPRRIAWKQSSWADELLTKEFAGGGTGETLWLEWEECGAMSTEHRLSRLCRWVLDCEAAGVVYGLKIPGRTITPDLGKPHRNECLAALALFGKESES